MVRRLVTDGEFIEVFDPKWLYAKAKAGTIRNFTRFDVPYEPPRRQSAAPLPCRHQLRLVSADQPQQVAQFAAMQPISSFAPSSQKVPFENSRP